MAFQMHLNDDNNEQEKSYRDFTLDRPGKIIFVGHHLSTGTQVRCLRRAHRGAIPVHGECGALADPHGAVAMRGALRDDRRPPHPWRQISTRSIGPRSSAAAWGSSEGAVVETNNVASAIPYDGFIAVAGRP